jgi:predicted secreted protein
MTDKSPQALCYYSDINKEETPMFGKKYFYLVTMAVFLGGSCLWAGDTASFVDLGFSPDGRIYMFAQYGIQAGSLKPWADLAVVDVPRNNFVPGGRVSYTHDSPVVAGQDGSGALYRILTRNTALAERYGVSFLLQGQPLYLSLENGGDPVFGETVEFRDFEQGASYKAALVPYVEGSGTNLKSSFYINLERTAKDGSKKNYVVGTPQVKRPLIASYRIRKVMVAPRDGSVIFVIEMRKQNNAGFDIRYMIEALRL